MLEGHTEATNPFFPLQTGYQTELGQTLDLITAPVSQVDLSRFSEQRYGGDGQSLVPSQPCWTQLNLGLVFGGLLLPPSVPELQVGEPRPWG